MVGEQLHCTCLVGARLAKSTLTMVDVWRFAITAQRPSDDAATAIGCAIPPATVRARHVTAVGKTNAIKIAAQNGNEYLPRTLRISWMAEWHNDKRLMAGLSVVQQRAAWRVETLHAALRRQHRMPTQSPNQAR